MWLSSSNILPVDELPPVSGSVSGRNGTNGGLFEGPATGVFSYFNGQKGKSYASQGDGTSSYVTYCSAKLSFGGGQSHNNMEPYKVVYIFMRSA